MSRTTNKTSFSGQTFFLCRCCADHSDTVMENETVTCSECGMPCNCQGCVAESYEPGGDPE